VPPQLERVSMTTVRAPAAFARPLVQRKLFRPPFKVSFWTPGTMQRSASRRALLARFHCKRQLHASDKAVVLLITIAAPHSCGSTVTSGAGNCAAAQQLITHSPPRHVLCLDNSHLTSPRNAGATNPPQEHRGRGLQHLL